MAYSLESVFKAARETQAKSLEAAASAVSSEPAVKGSTAQAAARNSTPADQAAMSPALRLWRPPSFDPRAERGLSEQSARSHAAVAPLPTVEEVEAIRAEAYKLGLDAGYEAGHQEGHREGFMAGHEEGMKRGHEEGYQASYSRGEAELAQLTQALQSMIDALEGMPQAIAEPLNELAFQVAERLSAKEGMDRGPFIAAIQEALTHFPKPGETMFLRVRPEDAQTWQRIAHESSLPFSSKLILDDHLPDGHAYVEIHGARLNVGYEARRAIARTALGLDESNDQ